MEVGAVADQRLAVAAVGRGSGEAEVTGIALLDSTPLAVCLGECPPKNVCQIEHTQHRRVYNFLVNLLAGWVAYTYQPRKPALLSLHNCLSVQPEPL